MNTERQKSIILSFWHTLEYRIWDHRKKLCKTYIIKMVWYILIFNLTSVTVCSVGPAVCSGPSDFSHLGPKIELLSPVPILQCNQLRRRTTTTMYYRAICQSYYCIVHNALVLCLPGCRQPLRYGWHDNCRALIWPCSIIDIDPHEPNIGQRAASWLVSSRCCCARA